MGIRGSIALASLFLCTSVLLGVVPGDHRGGIAPWGISCDSCYIPTKSVPLETAQYFISNAAAYRHFVEQHGHGWSFSISVNTGKPAYIGGRGIPLIPGHGNTLREEPSIETVSSQPSIQDVDRILRTFFQQHHDLFELEDRDLVLMEGSGFYGSRHYLCFMNYQITHEGIPVEGAILQARINHGNLVDMGIVGEYAPPTIAVYPTLSRDDAQRAVMAHLGRHLKTIRSAATAELKIIPVYHGPDRPDGFRIGHRLVWEMNFNLEEDRDRWKSRVDAHTGELVLLQDASLYDSYQPVHGQIYPWDKSSPLTDRPFSFSHVDSHGTSTSYSGLYPYTGGTASSTLNQSTHPAGSTLAWINDDCFDAELSSASGNLDWGGTTSPDCATANGNATEAALNAFYHTTQVKWNSLQRLPSNTWLSSPVEVRVNIDEAGASNWNGTLIRYYTEAANGSSGAYRATTISHETGHGLDDNDGIAIGWDMGTAEVVADTRSVSYLHWWDYTDERDYTVEDICNDCGDHDYRDPCGKEGHCTSWRMTETMYDLAARTLTSTSGMSPATAWDTFTELFHLSRPISIYMYQCTRATLCADWDSDGCASGNWYRTFRVVDDDNGNLCDGTPNGAAIYEAFNNHGIACSPSPGCPDENTSHTVCPSLSAPNLSPLTSGACSITLSWTSVSGAAEYRILRNELGADREFAVLTTVTSGVTTYTDTDVAPGYPYYYRVQAAGSNPTCRGELSTVQSQSALPCSACQIPSPPATASCTNAGGVIQVSWSGGNGDGYRVYRQKPDEHSWTFVSGDLGSVTTWQDTNFLCGQDYLYSVVSYESTNGPCNSSKAETGSCRVDCCTPPGAPTLQTLVPECDTMTLSWSPGSGTTNSYNIYRSEEGGSGPFTLIAGPITATTFIDSSPLPGREYTYKVRGACDSNGYSESPDSNSAAGTTSEAADISGLQSERSCSYIDLLWNPSLNATSYTVYRTQNENCTTDLTELDTVTGTTYRDTAVSSGNVYYYVVLPQNGCGESQTAKCTFNATLETPEVPTFTDVGCGTVTVHWKSCQGAETYDLYRNTGGCGSPGTLLASDLPSDTLTYEDSGLSLGQTYGYTVVSKNSCPYSRQGACGTVTITGLPDIPSTAPWFTNLTCDSVRINWDPVGGATTYDLYQNTGGCGAGVRIGVDLTDTFHDQTGLAGWQTYGFYIIAKNDCGIQAGPCETVTARPESAGIPFFSNITDDTLTVSWAPADRATSYDLYRKTGSCGTGSLIASDLSTPSYNDSNLACETTYGYYVVAKNSCATVNPGPCATAATAGVPPKPGSVWFTDIGNTSVTIHWDAVSTADSYRVYRRGGGCGTGGGLAASGITDTVYTDSGLACDQTYGYYIVAVNSCGVSPSGDCSSVTTTNQAPDQPGEPSFSDIYCIAARISWEAVPGADTYDLRRRQGDCSASGGLIAENLTSLNYFDTTLTEGTLYSYYVVAKNSCGYSSNGLCASITMPDHPDAPTGLVLTPRCGGISISWNSVPDAEEYDLYQTTSPDCITGASVVRTTSGTNADAVNTDSGVTYYFRVKARNDCGDSAFSACIAGQEVPMVGNVTGLSTLSTCSFVRLNWDPAEDADSYDIERSESPDCSASTVLGSTSDTTFDDDTAVQGTTYYYNLWVSNDCSARQGNECVTGSLTSIPTSPGLPSFSNIGCVTLTVSWNPVNGATHYDVYRAIGPCGSLSIYRTNLTNAYFDDTMLTAGTQYSYAIVAKNSCGQSAQGPCASVTTLTHLPAPTNLLATPGCSAISLSWDPTPGAVSYRVFRSVNPDCSSGAGVVGSPTEATFNDSTANPGVTYYYKVEAMNACGPSTGYSNCVSAQLLEIPGIPADVQAYGTCGGIMVQWTTVPGADTYEIYRTENSNCSTGLTWIGSSDSIDFNDSTVTYGLTYYYKVKASNACGESGFSACDSDTADVGPPAPGAPYYPVVDCTSLTVSWDSIPGAVTYQVYRTDGSCGPGIFLYEVMGTSYNDSGLSPDTEYSYYLIAKNLCGTSEQGSCSTVRTGVPATPAGLMAAGVCMGIELTWDAVPGATSYPVYRTENSDCITDLVQIDASSSNTYTDFGVTDGHTYYYLIHASNDCGTSGPSLCVSGETYQPPPTPTNPAAEGACAGITVTWDPAPRASSYTLYRGTSCMELTQMIPDVASPYEDTIVGAGETVYYSISAENSCGGSTGTECISATALTPAEPTVSGPSENTCPAETVQLSTEAGMTNYQWYKDTFAITGANAQTLLVTESGDYFVMYTDGIGCEMTSPSHMVTISACIPPDIDYDFYSGYTWIEDDGDGMMEAGEKWQIVVTLRNNGGSPATDILASLSGEGLTVCNNPGTYGTLAPGETASYLFEFIPDPTYWYKSHSCGDNLKLDMINLSSDSGSYTYPDEVDFVSSFVGSPDPGSMEQAMMSTPFPAQNDIASSALDTSFTIGIDDLNKAEVFWMLSGSTNITACVAVRLRAPDGESETTVKAFNTADPGQAVVTSFYRSHGPGTYTMVLEEMPGCSDPADFASLDWANMTVNEITPGGCDVGGSLCGTGVPEVSDDALHYLKVTKNGSLVDLLFEAVGVGYYQIYISTLPSTSSFQVSDPTVGRTDCLFRGWKPDQNGMLRYDGYDLEEGLTGSTETLFFLITADAGAGTEGSLGFDSTPLERSADSYCSR
ncbi:MAG TPA: hypothetical protein PK014_05815 [Thermoanaerobaculia bacterium]|nr:hypothetical protein [Thermoanaerobaculia bacterium]HUM29612.1 hypothetical protein [Thermoanaerobaculia bacterium]HXK67263.1 hypothetical protein [Thermoanaerobaculia bacterium]